MRTPSALMFAMLLAAAQANAAPPLFLMEGHCNGSDMVYSWNGGSGLAPPKGQYGKAFIYPWRDDPITIRGVEVVIAAPAKWEGYFIGPAYFGWLMVGNDATEDIMLMMGSDQPRGANMFPGESGFFSLAKIL